MKNNSLIIKALLFGLILQSCKKESSHVTDTAANEPSAEFVYKAPDTTTAQPGIYMVTYKETFAKPFAKLYTGSRSIRGARITETETYNRTVKTKLSGALQNPDGSYKVPLQNITGYFSTLVVGFEAELDKQMVKKLVEDPRVKYVERQVEENSDADVSSGTKVFSPQAQTVDALRQQIGYKNAISSNYIAWILDSGCDMDHPDLNIGAGLAKNFAPNEYSVEDLNGHGTKVAGVLAAIDNSIGTRGSAAGAPIVPIRIKKADDKSYPSIFVKGLEYVWTNSIDGDVVNMSQITRPQAKTFIRQILVIHMFQE